MWLSAILYIFVLFLLCVWFYRYTTYKPDNFPPGPPRFPLWGSYILCLLYNWNFPQIPFQKWAKKYGNVFGLYLGDFPCVVACDYETCKEVLTRVEFDGKPDLVAARARNIDDKLIGIFFTEGAYWHEQRRFSLRHLRDYGFGRRFEKLELLMKEQYETVIDFIKYAKPCPEEKDILREDGAILFPDILYPAQLNAVMSIFGMEPEHHNSERYRSFRKIGEGVMDLQRGFFGITVMNLTPWMKYVAPKTTGYYYLQKSNKVLFPFFKKVIEESRKYKVSDDEVHNFFDEYYRKKYEYEENGESHSFSDDQLLMTTIDYMFPAVSAVPITFVQIMYSLFKHPHCQEKMQKEIDEVVGRGRLPTLDDRKDMPYTEAVIREVMRKETLVPIGIVHKTLEDTTLKGYSLPKNTLVFTSLYGAHMDEKIWGDPENFRPERFIAENGKLIKKDYSLPFGAGKRLCAGETFARNSLFLIVSSLYQNFNFKAPKGTPIPDIDKKLPGLINMPQEECWILAEQRN